VIHVPRGLVICAAVLLAGCDGSSPTGSSPLSLDGRYRFELTTNADCVRDAIFRVLRFDLVVSSSGTQPGDVVLATLPEAEEVFTLVGTFGASGQLSGTIVNRGTNVATGRPLRFTDQADRHRAGENAIWLEGPVFGTVTSGRQGGEVLDGTFRGELKYEISGPFGSGQGGCGGYLHTWTLRPH